MDGSESRNASKIFNSSIGVAIGFGISGVFSMATRIVLGRILEPAGYGVLSEALAVFSFLVIFSQLGLRAGITRFLSYGDEKGRPLTSGLAISMPVSIAAGGLLFLLSGRIEALMASPGLGKTLQVFALNVPALTGLGMFLSGYRGRKKTFEPVFLKDAALPAVILFSAGLLVLVSPQPYLAAVGYALGGWAAFAMASAHYLWKNPVHVPTKADILKLADFSLPLWAANLLQFGITWINILIVGVMLHPSKTGLYNAANPISYSVNIGLASLGFLFLPVASSLHGSSRQEELESLYRTVERWLAVISLPVALALVLEPGFFLAALFGPSYLGAAPLLRVLAAARLVNVLFGPLGQMIVAFGETRWEAVARFSGLAVIISGSLALIPVWGITGAGIAYFTGETVTNLLRLHRARRYGDFNPLSADFLKPAAAASAASLLLVANFTGFWWKAAAITLFGIAYLLLLLGSRPLKEEDIHSMEQMMERVPLENTDKTVGWLRKFQE